MKLFSALAQLIPVFLVGVILVLVTHMKKLGQPCQQPMATVHTWQSNRDVNFENQEFLPRPSKSEVVLSLSEANQSSTHRNQLEYDRLNFSKGFIEPIIHQMWKSESSIGSFGRNSQRSWQDLNPSYKYMFHTDADMEENMKEWHPELAHAWSQMKVIEKADTYRYAVVHRFGGYYADMDVVCEQPIDDWMAQYHVYDNVGVLVGFESINDRPDWADWYARQFQFCQWVFAAHKGHPILKIALRNIGAWFRENPRNVSAEPIKEKKFAETVLHSTGPGIFTDAVLEYLQIEHGILFSFNAEGKRTINGHAAKEERLHIGNVMILPIRSFALNSGGYKLQSHHPWKDVLVRHHFKHTWRADS
eukprot:m.1346995 g.1346995  ORF g.1346995 m.1346995 type:complete len:361 (+) comp24908_c2_seq13:248-1330(+)